jgi:hypothetical protein
MKSWKLIDRPHLKIDLQIRPEAIIGFYWIKDREYHRTHRYETLHLYVHLIPLTRLYISMLLRVEEIT